MIKIFYGCARKHRLDIDHVLFIYNDIDKRYCCNYTCDIRDILSGKKIPGINLCDYDGVIFTPPCNYYSRANYRRETSLIAQETKDLLPKCLLWCALHQIPFLVENVANKSFLGDYFPQYQFVVGNHTYWSNVISKADFLGVEFEKNQRKNFVAPSKRNDNKNVDIVIKTFVRKLVHLYDNRSVYE